MRRLALSLVVLLCAPVSAQAAGPRILATGDSMMRGLDRSLARELGRVQPVSLRSVIHIGEGITNEPWVRISRRKAKEHRPRATVAFMGANDGYDMKGALCCGKAWLAKYADRVDTDHQGLLARRSGRRVLADATRGRVRPPPPALPEDQPRHWARRGPLGATRARRGHLARAHPGGHFSSQCSGTASRSGLATRTESISAGWALTIVAELVRDAMVEDGVLTAPDP